MEREIQLAEAAGIVADHTGEHAGDVVIDVDFSWLNSMKEKLASTCAKSSPSFTIRRVPAHIRDSDRAAYCPSIISIGPFHRQSTNLQAMEEHKWRYLRKVLSRSKPENDLEKYLKEMKAKEAQARNCYSESFTIGSNGFVEMMVLDGCFVIQFIHEVNYAFVRINDPIYDNEWMASRICDDMLLLENQLPFFVLECLWELIGQPRATLREEALTFFRPAFPNELELKCPKEDDIHHLLHAVHLALRPAHAARKRQSMTTATGKLSCLQLCKDMGKILPFLRCLVETRDMSTPTGQQSLLEYNPPSTVKMVPCAMELQEAGFGFQRKQARSFLDVTFENGLMKMPRLWITDYTNALFRNFIAFEQCFPKGGNHFTSYCFLIDALVDTPRDVSILSQSNIIEHVLGSDEEVALLFNKLFKEIVWTFECSYLANMFEEVIQHTQKRWPKWRAKLVHDYFSNPWAIISVIAAIVILIVALVQTFFAVFAYFRPPKP
ncbi:hypothetical protein AAC387_Pa04g0391 [Persea americana]